MVRPYLIVCLLRVGLGILLAMPCLNAGADIAVIINPQNKLAELSNQDLKKIFLGRMLLFPNSSREIHPVDLPVENPVFQHFYRQVVELEGVDLKRYRAYYLFSGRGRLPAVADSPMAVIETVRQDEGAIGYIDERDVTPDTRVLMMLPLETGD